MSSSHWRADVDDDCERRGKRSVTGLQGGVAICSKLYFMHGVIYFIKPFSATYDHRLRTTGHPVRSAIHKPQIGRLVVGWVTTSEYLLLYVFIFYIFEPYFLATENGLF
jgi:hypothetical protein